MMLPPNIKYTDLLKRHEWDERRREILRRADYRCEACGQGDRKLHVHHGYYRRDWKPWQYPDSALWALCEKCHKKTQECLTELHRIFGGINPAQLPDIVRYARRYCRNADDYETDG